MDLPDLTLRSTSIATSYRFLTSSGSRNPGWAICTVNDATGELGVQSDWGNWAYRSRAPNLTAFIGATYTLHGDHCDRRHYLADKLTSGEHGKRHVFSPEKTVGDLRARVCARRRDGEIDAELARELYDALGELEHTDDTRDFIDGYYRIEGHDKITRYAIEMEDLREDDAPSYLVLRDAILPALIAACAADVHARNERYLAAHASAAMVAEGAPA